MIGKTLANFGRRMGWYLGDDAIFGLHRNYLVSISQHLVFRVPRRETICLNTIPIPPDQRADIRRDLDNLRLPVRFVRAEVNDCTLCLHYRRLFCAHDRYLILELINGLIDVARRYALAPDLPPVKDPTTLRFCIYEGRGVVLRQEEYNRLIAREVVPFASSTSFARSYSHGVAGGSLYALVGVIPTVVAAYLMDPIPVVAGIGVAFLCYYGYRQFNGTAGSRTTLAMLMLSLLWILVSTGGSFWIRLVGEGRSWTEAWWLAADLRWAYLSDCSAAVSSGLLVSFLLSQFYLRSARRIQDAVAL